jgi:hypothetical protein
MSLAEMGSAQIPQSGNTVNSCLNRQENYIGEMRCRMADLENLADRLSGIAPVAVQAAIMKERVPETYMLARLNTNTNDLSGLITRLDRAFNRISDALGE